MASCLLPEEVAENLKLIGMDNACVHFDSTEYQDFNEALSKVRQTRTVQESRTQFEYLANRVVGWPEKALVGLLY